MTQKKILSKIEKLIDDYVNCWKSGKSGIIGRGGSIYIGNNVTPCEQKYLIIQHYKIHDFSLDVLRKLPVLLIKTHEAQNVNHDHKYLWAWTAQLINDLRDKLTLLKDREFLEQLNLVFRINLLPTSLLASFCPNLVEIFAKDFIISAHLAFPLLERLLRIKCEKHVTVNGIVTNQFSVPTEGGKKVYKKGKRINRVGHLLYLFYNNYASNELKENLDDFCSFCESVYEVDRGDYGFKFIDDWRNILIHGEKFWPVMNAAIVNLVTLILLHEIPLDVYSNEKDRILKSLDSWNKSGQRPPWVFYPPEF